MCSLSRLQDFMARCPIRPVALAFMDCDLVQQAWIARH
jgi:hypothetical protein